MIHRLRAFPDYLAGVPLFRRIYILGVLLLVGLALGGLALAFKVDADHQRETNARQDRTDQRAARDRASLRRLILSFRHLQRNEVLKLIARLGPARTRALVTELRRLVDVGGGAIAPRRVGPTAGTAPPRAGQRGGNPSPSAPGLPQLPGPTEPAPPRPRTIDPPPTDLDGPGMLPPVDPPPVPCPLELPRLTPGLPCAGLR